MSEVIGKTIKRDFREVGTTQVINRFKDDAMKVLDGIADDAIKQRIYEWSGYPPERKEEIRGWLAGINFMQRNMDSIVEDMTDEG